MDTKLKQDEIERLEKERIEKKRLAYLKMQREREGFQHKTTTREQRDYIFDSLVEEDMCSKTVATRRSHRTMSTASLQSGLCDDGCRSTEVWTTACIGFAF